MSVATMSYAGALPILTTEWNMSAGQAGTVQAAFNIGYAASLLVTSWFADRIGPKRVFLWSLWSSAAAFVAFAVLTRSYQSAVLLFGLVGLLQGGTYTPAIMLVAQELPPERRGSAIGALLAAGALGFIVAILATVGLTPLLGYEATLCLAALGPTFGAIVGTAAVVRVAQPVGRKRPEEQSVPLRLFTRSSILLTVAYAGHSWEVLGMWAWAPAFLSAAFADRGSVNPLTLALFVAMALHMSSVLANLFAGLVSDRWGRRQILIIFAWAGAIASFAFGWCMNLPAAALFAVAFVYGFAAVGDSGVLSTAMTESVPPAKHGTLLALRSVLGYGAGSVSPIAFGLVLDSAPHWNGMNLGWGLAFVLLGIGGAVAGLCSFLLPHKPPLEAAQDG